MDTRKLTESAMLSVLFVVAGIFFISSVIGYQIYLDLVVPILITLIYLRCDFKYTLMSAITSLVLITFVFGNPAIGIWMLQNITIGFVCGFLITRKSRLFDDIFYCSLFAAVILVFVDVFFSGIIGYSFISEAQGYLVYIEGSEALKEVIFYLILAALPLGTVIMTYLGGLFLGKKLRLLNENGLRKFLYVRKFKRYGNLQYCSEKTIFAGIIYVAFMKLIGRNNIFFKFTYLKTVLITMEYIILYFILKDSYSLVCNFIYKVSGKGGIVMIFQMAALYSLVCYFTVTALILTIGGLVIDKRFKVRENSDKFLNRINLKAELC